MDLEILQTKQNDIESMIKDLEMNRDELGHDIVDAEILKLKEKKKHIQNQIHRKQS